MDYFSTSTDTRLTSWHYSITNLNDTKQHLTVMDLSVWCVMEFVKSFFKYFLLIFFFISFSLSLKLASACRDGKLAESTKHARHCIQMRMYLLYCLFPDTPHHLAQIKIYLTRCEHRGVKRGGQPEKETEMLSHKATKEKVIFQSGQSLAEDWCGGQSFHFPTNGVLWFAKINFCSTYLQLYSTWCLPHICSPIPCSLLCLIFTNLSSRAIFLTLLSSLLSYHQHSMRVHVRTCL